MKFLFAAAAIVAVTCIFTARAHAAPATFTVTNTNDSGAGSLRQAIDDANSNGNPSDMDVIQFNIAGSGVKTISPASQYSPITEKVTIDGYSQPGACTNTAAAPNPMNGVILIELDGSNVGDVAQQAGLAVFADNSVIKGLSVYGFAPRGVLDQQANVAFLGANNKLQGCYIGLKADGLTRGSNARESTGVSSVGQNMLIGGQNAADRNVIVNFSAVPQAGGIMIASGTADIYGNYIGLGKDGVTDPTPEPADPLQLNAPFGVGINILNDAGARLGGTGTGMMNVISGNRSGNVLVNSETNLDVVQGNKIGTDYSGLVRGSITNGYGVTSAVGSFTLIGGTNAGEGNLIAGNSGAGVGIFGGVENSSGQLLAAANKISLLGNTIYSSQIFDFQGFGASNLGIDLFLARFTLGGPSGFTVDSYEDFGPTPNDTSDPDTGPNNKMNYPVLKTAQQVGNQLTITYDLDAADSPSNTYRVEFFANDASTIFGHGPGQTYLGAASSVTPGTNKTVTLTVSGDQYKKALSATTTAIDNTTGSGFGSTSEFAQNISIGNGSDFDADGISDTVENQAPNNGDGNNDGTPDRLQPTVTTLEIDSTGIFETFVTSGCSDNGLVASIDTKSLPKQDSGKTYPYGLTDFSLNCSRGNTVNVTKYVFTDAQPTSFTLRKYNDITNTYRDVPGSSIASEQVGTAKALVARYSITDGGELDDDNTANGVIVDPVGLATTDSLASTGVNIWFWIAAAVSLIGVGFAVSRQTVRERS